MNETKSLFSLQFWIGLVISAVCVALLIANVPLDEILPRLSDGNYSWLLLAIGFQFASIIVRSWRWMMLLQGKPSFMTAFWAQGVGYLFTNVFPLRLGEPARIFVLSWKSDIPYAETTATAVVERVFDLATVIIFLLLVLPFMGVPLAIIQAGQFFGILVIIAFVVLLLGARYPQFFVSIVSKILSPIPRVRDIIVPIFENLMAGLQTVKSVKTMLITSAASFIMWGFSVLAYWAAIHIFVASGTMIEATFMVVAVSLAVTVPSSPGFIGVFQLVAERALVLPFGDKYSLATALSIALITYLVYYFTTTLMGIIGIWQLGSSVGEVLSKVRKKLNPASS